MREPDNIHEAEDTGVDMMGFIFYAGSSRFVGDREPVITSRVRRVGVFVNEDIDRISEIAGQWKLDIIQLHGDETPEDCLQVAELGLEVVKAFAVDEEFDFSRLRPYVGAVDYFLFDTKGKNYGGNGQVFNWELLSKYEEKIPFWLSGGIGPELSGAISTLDFPGLYAIDVNSGFEEKPGFKNIEKLKQFTDELQN